MLLSTSSVTGPAELCLSDALDLRKQGHEVLFGLDTRRPGNYRLAIEGAGFQVMDELTLCPKPTASELVSDIYRLRRRLAAADLVHCRFAHEHSLCLVAMNGLGRRPALVRTAEIARSLRRGWLRSKAFRASHAVLVPCRNYGRSLERDHGVAPERVHVIPGRVDGERFSPKGESLLRNEALSNGGDVLFGIVSRIKEDRRHEVLIRAFAALLAERPRARLAVVGRGEHEPAMRDLVSALGVGNSVFFAGYRTGDSLVDAYRGFDVTCWLAEGNDGTCRALLEGMACGKPALTAREGAMGEIVRDGIEGFAVEPEVQEVRQAMRGLLDGESRARMGAAARARALEYGPERRAAALTAAYEAAIDLRASGDRRPAGRAEVPGPAD